MNIFDYILYKKIFGGTGGSGGDVTSEEITVTPTKETQVVTPATADYIKKVTVDPIPEEYIVPTGEMTVTENGDHDVTEYAGIKVAVPIPEGYLVPEGVLSVTENGTHDVTEYASVDVDVAGMDADPWDQDFEVTGEPQEGNPLTEFIKAMNGTNFFYNQDQMSFLPSTFAAATYGADMTSCVYMFYNCKALKDVPLFDTSNVTNMYGMFYDCAALTSVPQFDTSSVTNMQSMFSGCRALKDVPLFDTSKVTAMQSMFYNNSVLTSVPELDCRNVTNFGSMFYGCSAITDIAVRNIKINLNVGSGTSYGHLLTVDSLVHLIYELRQQSSSKTLTMGAANLEKLANVYVKLIDITDDMRAEDDLIDEKLPFVVCESTDEGATLITTYVSAKNWALA